MMMMKVVYVIHRIYSDINNNVGLDCTLHMLSPIYANFVMLSNWLFYNAYVYNKKDTLCKCITTIFHIDIPKNIILLQHDL